MNAVDTNILVHAHREESPHHERALDTIRGLATADEPWVLFWPCLYEFVRVVTHHAIFDPPTPLAQAILAVEGLCASPSVLVLGETHRHSLWFSRMLTAGDARGNLVFDAHRSPGKRTRRRRVPDR